MDIHRCHTSAAITVPNGGQGGFKTKLKELGVDGFRDSMMYLERRIKPTLDKLTGVSGRVYVVQQDPIAQGC